jgi:hypothetical protein
LLGALSAGTTTYLLWRNDRCFVTFGSLKIDVVRVLTTGHNIMQPRKNIYTTYPFFLTKIQMPVKKISTEKYTLSDDYITTGVKLF